MGALDLDPGSIGEVVLRTLAVYVALLLLLRLAGKRELGQMTTFDLVVVLIISNAVQNAMVGANVSLTAGIAAAATLLVANAALDRAGLRSAWLRERFRGVPTLLIHAGAVIPENLRRERVDEDELMQALREHGVDDIRSVKTAVLE
ncbi:MAG TPA: YetF domain-containing protein, partial [Candidatus Limnocylindria bacterium]